MTKIKNDLNELANSIVQSLSFETDSRPASQEIPRLLWNPV
jgi:hypothetical protein